MGDEVVGGEVRVTEEGGTHGQAEDLTETDIQRAEEEGRSVSKTTTALASPHSCLSSS